MKVLFDYQIFIDQKYGGVSRYFVEIIKRFNLINEVEIDLSLLYSENYYLQEFDIFKHNKFLKNFHFRGKKRLLNFINQEYSKKSISKTAFDIIHPTYYDPYFVSYIKNKPTVVTCYDMIHEKFSQQFPSLKSDTIPDKKASLNAATKVIAISNTTKQDLIDFYKIDPSNVVVTYLASSLQLDESYDGKQLKDLPEKYFLFVGNRALYKNFDSFLQAISPLLKKDKDLYLVCAGGGKFSKDEINKMQLLKVLNKVKFYQINDRSLAYLYNKAHAFFFPSLYEGFGIPVLEAFNCGCPAIISASSSLQEVGGSAALYLDPTNKDSILNAAEEILDNDVLRKRLIGAGDKQKMLFSWDKTADQTLDLYKSLV